MLLSLLKHLQTTFVFCYHRVIPEKTAKYQQVNRALYVTPDTFEQHIRWMKDVGEIIDCNEIFCESAISRRPKFIVTFDDGWKDNYIHALPILKRYDAPATIFLSTYNINQQRLFWPEEVSMAIRQSPKCHDEVVAVVQHFVLACMKLINDTDSRSINNNWSPANRLYLLDRFIECLKVLPARVRDNFISSIHSELDVPYEESTDLLLTWDLIHLMKAHRVTFGSHTHTHPILDRMDEVGIDYELYTSRQILEASLGGEVNLFSYPNGCYKNVSIQSSLRKFGYKYAFTLDRFPVRLDTEPLLIPRCLLYEDIAQNIQAYWLKVIMKTYLTERGRRTKGLLLNSNSYRETVESA
jgi:peptidoglycan/xylan/chitin deacetylase (PgdA/CDA1 family)